jgi:peptide/nickel transport system substrate-binding protein
MIPTVGGTYVEGVAGSPHYINPLLSADNPPDEDLCELIFRGLTRLDSSGQVVEELARRWEISLDGLTYVFHLRTDVLWHDGARFTADDVLATVRLLQDPDYPGPRDVGTLWQTVQVEKDDEYTVRFVLSEPYAPFIDHTTIGILPAHLVEGIRAAEILELPFNLNPVGTGPFQVDEVEIEGEQIVSVLLARNPDYYGEGPMLENFRLRFYPSTSAVFQAYATGEINGLGDIQLADLERAEAIAGLNFYSAQMTQYSMIMLNLGQPNSLPFFQDKEVRQALLYGLDRELLIASILDGRGIVAHSPIVADTWAYDEQIRRYSYDPDEARLLLDETDWTLPPAALARNNSGTPFVFTLLASTDPVHSAMADEVARQWGELNIQVTVVTTSPVGLRSALESRDFDAALIDLAMAGDPDPYPLWHQTQISTGQNYAGFNHRRISEIIETARVIVNQEQRVALYQEFQDLFADEVPALLLYHPIYTYGVADRIQGVQIAPLAQPSDRFTMANTWYLTTRRVIISQAEVR